MKKCRVGDLAIIVNSGHSDNLGKTVLVVGEPTTGATYETSRGFVAANPATDWLVQPANSPLRTMQGLSMSITQCRDASLMPIRPSDEKFLEDELTRELEGVQ